MPACMPQPPETSARATDSHPTDVGDSAYQSVARIIVHEACHDFEMPFKIRANVMASGTGFFVDGRAHMLTCSHVVAHASHVYVQIPQEGRVLFKAEVLGVCPAFDIAMLRVLNYTNRHFCALAPAATHSHPDNVQPGDTAHALGFPLGQDNLKVTKGIVSGQQHSMYQIDTPINPGNSGGPLVHNGVVIGINGAGVLTANNVGYAVPIARVFLLGKLLYEKRRLIHFPNSLGIQYQNTTPQLRRFLGCTPSKLPTRKLSKVSRARSLSTSKRGLSLPDSAKGIYIKRVFHGSVIQHLRLRQGDILCAINEHSLDQYGDLDCRWMGQKMTLANLLATLPLHKRAVFTFWSSQKRKMVRRGIILREHHMAIRHGFPVFEPLDYEVIGGMVVVPLSLDNCRISEEDNREGHRRGVGSAIQATPAHLVKYMEQTNQHQHRLLISAVLPGSVISTMRCIPPKSVIDTINDRPVETMAQFRAAMQHPLQSDGETCIKIVTKDRNIAILPVSDVLAEEAHLREVHKYPCSDLVGVLSKKGGCRQDPQRRCAQNRTGPIGGPRTTDGHDERQGGSPLHRRPVFFQNDTNPSTTTRKPAACRRRRRDA